jgi:hypothetical protein
MMLLTTASAWADNVNVTSVSDFGTKTEGSNATTSGYYTLTDGNTYTLQGDVTIDGYLSIPAGTTVTIDLNGHALNRGLTSSTALAKGFVINVKGSLTLNDSQGSGTVTGGHAMNIGAGLVVDGENATFTMNGGCITGNKQATSTTQSGGGVSVRRGATFTMNGGSITNNTTTKNGGGVFVETATFNMNGGTISGNKCPSDYDGAGVYVYYHTSNGNHATFNISGSAVVTGNTKGNNTTDNVYLCDNAIINVTGAFTNSANIGVRMADRSDFFAQGSGYTLTVSDASRFSSDVSGYHSALDSGKGKLYLSDKDPALLSVLAWNRTGGYFEIRDEQDLIDLAEYVRSASDHNCKGLTFKMTRDFDFTNMPADCHDNANNGSGNFLPIGVDNFYGDGSFFKGHFDGQGHTITGLRFYSTDPKIGLFSTIGTSETVIEGVTLVVPNFYGSGTVGGIVGTLYAGTIRNCAVVNGTISGRNGRVGGIVGLCNYYLSTDVKTISGCTVIATTVNATTVNGSSEIGIIVGKNQDTSEATAAPTISGCTYHNPAGLPVCGVGNYTDGGGNQQVYQVRLSDGLTASTAAYSYGNDYYFANNATVTLGHGDRPGYDFSGYESNDVTVSNGTFTMPASDVTISAAWTPTFTGGLTLAVVDNKLTATLDGSSVTTLNIPTDITVEAVVLNRTFTTGKCATIMLPFSMDVNNISGTNFYTFGGVEKNSSDKWIATMNQMTGTLAANTPYLVEPTATTLTFTGGATLNTTGGGNQQTADAGSNWMFKGTYAYREWITDGANSDEIGKAYGFAGVQKTGIEIGDFVRVASGAKIRPMGCYLLWSDTPNAAPARRMTRGASVDELPSRITVRLVGSNGETTSISELDTKTGELSFDGWWTLDGTKLSGKPTKKGLYISNGKKIVIK